MFHNETKPLDINQALYRPLMNAPEKKPLESIF